MENSKLALALVGSISSGCITEHASAPSPLEIRLPAQAPQQQNIQKVSVLPPSQSTEIITVTERMRWKLYENQCDRKMWESCGSKVSKRFFDLTKLIPISEDQKCRRDGDYEPGCVENVYRQIYGEDALLATLEALDNTCEQKTIICNEEALSNCDNNCWKKIQKQLEEGYKNIITEPTQIK